jgi:amino acid transporter
MKLSIFIIIIIIIILLFYLKNKIKENFVITTWTPYVLDEYNQPGYSNYFYNGGYMYPIY